MLVDFDWLTESSLCRLCKPFPNPLSTYGSADTSHPIPSKSLFRISVYKTLVNGCITSYPYKSIAE
jgi:hypothetical protein